MSKSERVLSFLPAFYNATDKTKLLYEVVHRLAQPFEEADTHLFRVQRAHRIKVAENTEDIIRLSAILNLNIFHFEDILAEDIDYRQKLDLMRERVRRIARVHLSGLGTPWAVMECAAIFLNAKIVPESQNAPLIRHLDNEHFFHMAVIEFPYLPNKPRERIYLQENPLRRQKVDPASHWQMNSWAIKNSNVSSSKIKFVIQGIGDRTVLPCVFSDAGEGILFNGIIPDGKKLIIDETDGALLDNHPVDEWIIYFKGGTFDNNFSKFDVTNFVCEQNDHSSLFNGDLEEIVISPYVRRKSVPSAPIGRSNWFFKVTEGLYDGTDYDFSVFESPTEPLGKFDVENFDECVYDFPASGVVGMAWDESVPCSFKLLLPQNVPGIGGNTNPGKKGEVKQTSCLNRIGNIVTRFKAAGIQAFVDSAKDAWILGQSVIRGIAETEGEGIEFNSTSLQDLKADRFVVMNNATRIKDVT